MVLAKFNKEEVINEIRVFVIFYNMTKFNSAMFSEYVYRQIHLWYKVKTLNKM